MSPLPQLSLAIDEFDIVNVVRYCEQIGFQVNTDWSGYRWQAGLADVCASCQVGYANDMMSTTGVSVGPKQPEGESLKKPDGSPRALQRVLDIFAAIAANPGGLSLTELSVRVKTPKSSLLTLLRPLSIEGYLIHQDGRYTLGSEIFALSESILAARKVGNLLKELMLAAQEECGETVVYATFTREGDEVTYVDVLESPQMIRYSVPAGVRRPLYTSAVGQLLLAYKDEAWQEQYLSRVPLKPLTGQTITDPIVLRKKLRKIKADGVSISISEAVDGAAGVAAPIFDARGDVLGALLIAGPSMRQSRERTVWRDVAVRYAARASRALGHRIALHERS